MKKPELMAPAGDWTMLSAAVNAGADAVYFGIDKLNMRAKAANFSLDGLKEMSDFCIKKHIKTYLTLNTIVYENELNDVKEIISQAKNFEIDKIICWDLSVIQICKELEMPFVISTQASISNSSSAKFYKDIGAGRVVLARECSLEDIIAIKKNVDIEVEVFIHGAMCIAVSGRCFMSHHLFGKSANRGECIQPCRREYEVYDPSIKKSMIIGEDYIMSPNDLCSIEFIDKLIDAGIDSFKIEGRKRSPEYVSKTVSVYRRAIDLHLEKKLTDEIKKEMLADLGTVFNRGFSSGFYFDTPGSSEYTNIYGSRATTQKIFAGKVINYYKKAKAAYISVDAGTLKIDDDILIIGPTTGVVSLTIPNILNEEIELNEASKGDRITFPCSSLVRPHDQVYLLKKL